MFRYGNAAAAARAGMATFNPADPSQQVGSYGRTEPSDVAALVALARDAQRDWAAQPVFARINVLSRWLDAVATRSEEIARAITLE